MGELRENTAVQPVKPARVETPKRPYKPPQLTLLGDLRDVTLGPSAGTGESGNPAIFRA